MYDIVIRNGTVIDGEGTRAFQGDIAIRDGRIVAVGEAPGEARQVIDAAGRVVAGGDCVVAGIPREATRLPRGRQSV